MRLIKEYARKIISGKIVAGRFMVMACKRFEDDLRNAKKRGFVFDEEKAAHAISFFPTFLVHTKGAKWAGKPFELSLSQKFIVANLFGWRRKDDGSRRFRKAYITVARKWGKSSFAAGLAALMLYADDPIEAGAEGYVAATKEDQAKIVHNIACRMVKQNPHLDEITRLFKSRDTFLSLVLEGEPYNGSVFKPLGSDSDKTDGLNPHFVIKDELHEWKEHHRGLKEKLETGSGSRLQPLDITITTAGDDHSKLWQEEDEYCCRIVEAAARGEQLNDNLFVFIARIDDERPCSCNLDADCKDCGGSGRIPGDDPFDESCWPKANPEIGLNPTWDFMREQGQVAQQQPSFKRTFLRYHLNRRVDSKIKMISDEMWALGAEAISDWSQETTICGAFDLGWRDDLAAIVMSCRKGSGDETRFEFKHLAFCCEGGKRDLTVEPWPTWIRNGNLIVTPGDTTDINLIRNFVVDWSSEYGCFEWRFDPANARQLGTELANDHGLMAVEFTQTYSRYNEPMRDFVRALRSGEVCHGNDPVLGWAAGNVIAKEGNRGEIMPDKSKSADKIDPMSALFMAFSGVMAGKEPQARGDYYESNELELM